MITVYFQGGLGNQMFQYAAGRAVAERLGTGLRFDTSWYHYPVKRRFMLQDFGIKAPTVKSPLSFVTNLVFKKPFSELMRTMPVYRAEGYVFDPSVFEVADPSILVGFFQSEKYFKPIENIIRSDFSFQQLPYDPMTDRWLNRIKDTCSVAVHVRRGDYLNHPKLNVCTEAYFRRAIDRMKRECDNARFYFFSDDLDWCRLTFQGREFIFCDAVATDASPIRDMQLMARCRHHILSNSSFSWWGAWLGCNADQIVIAPEKWLDCEENTNDIPCEEWLRLQC